jgi:sulfur-carrier protein adenylyltransferase/sulfurtransferase
MMIENISVAQLFDKIKNNDEFRLLDVREDWEYNLTHLDRAELLPLNQIQNKLNILDKSSQIIVYCHYGHRSYKACEILSNSGFKNVINVLGGIDEYSKIVDSNIKRY